MHQGEADGQTFEALTRKIRRVTVWRPAYQDTFYADLHMYLFATDSLGTPIRNPLSESRITVPFGDGIHPVRMDFNLDPPWVLPSLGKYAIAFQPRDCGFMTLLASDRPGAFDQGILWGSNRTWPYYYVGRFTGYPDADLVFEIEFCQSTICATADEGGQATLQAPEGWVISDIDLASYGNPGGACGAMSSGTCEAPRSRDIVESTCLGQPGCTVAADPSLFGDPCPGTPKRLAIQATIHPVASDLVLTYFDAPAIGGTPIPVRFTVVNRGSKPSGPFDTSIRISPDSTVDLQDQIILSRHTTNLDPGDSIAVSTTLDLPPEPRGSVFLGVAVDEANHVDEQVESNNRCIAPHAYAAPRILSIRDVPNDQGGNVSLQVLASDAGVAGSIVSYDAYRRDAGVWHYESSARADGSSTYTILAPTSGDSTALGIPEQEFMARASTSDPRTHYDSPSMLGYSVDNLAPAGPLSLVGEYLPREVRLRWRPSPDHDAASYRVYRLRAPDFRPSPARLIAVLADTSFTDSSGTVFNTYGVSTVDLHGNEGPVAIVAYGQELRFELVGVTPNPVVSGPIDIAFMLQAAQTVHLELLDVAGRRLLRQEVGHLGPGFHTVPIDRRVAPGLYFVRLIRQDASGAPDIRSRKLTVLR